jgi:hypothetical protein
MSTFWTQKDIVEAFISAANRVFYWFEAESAKNKEISRNSVSRTQTSARRPCHESKKSLVSKNDRVKVSTPTTPTSISRALPSTEKATCVLAPYSPEVDHMVKCAFKLCLVDIFFLPYSCPLKKKPTKISAFPLSHAATDSEMAEQQDDDSEDDETFFSRIARELSSHDDVLSENEGQVQDLNFIVEGCTFRGNLEIPTPPPSFC